MRLKPSLRRKERRAQWIWFKRGRDHSNLPVKMKRIGVNDTFGESGKNVLEYWKKHGLDVDSELFVVLSIFVQ